MASSFLNPTFKYVLAISGGVDSSVLLHQCALLIPKENIVVAHFNHGTQKPYCTDAQHLVQKKCKKEGVRCFVGYRKGRSLSENSLRRERRLFLEKIRQNENADFIVTAHTADDQLETILMRLLRGTGLRGLGGMALKRGKYLRPFLKLSKAHLEEEARRQKITFVTDPTNNKPLYLRNRVRANLAPPFLELAREFGGPEAALRRVSDLCTEIRSTQREIQKQTKLFFDQKVTRTAFWFRFSKDDFLKLSKFWRGHVIRYLYKNLNAEVPDRIRIKEILESIQKERSLSAQHGVSVMSSCGFVYFQNALQRKAYGRTPSFTKAKGEFFCSLLGIRITIPSHLENSRPRFFMPGDRFGSQKLKRVFLKYRIPMLERKFVPVLAKGLNVEWFYPREGKGINVLVGFPFARPPS